MNLMKFLFINDDQELLNTLSAIFKDRKDVAFAEGHSVEEAWRAVAENQPEVLFLDHELTEGGNEGLEIARKLKGVKIYSTTAHKGLIERYQELGIDHINPMNLKELKSILGEASQEIKHEIKEGQEGKRK